jgi:hypothetical protein
MPDDRIEGLSISGDDRQPESVIRASGASSSAGAYFHPPGLKMLTTGQENTEWRSPAMEGRRDDRQEDCFEGEIDDRPLIVRTCDLLSAMTILRRYATEPPPQPPPTS